MIWDAAHDLTARRFTEIISKARPDPVAFCGSGQINSQAVYCDSKLFKRYLGTNNTDLNSPSTSI